MFTATHAPVGWVRARDNILLSLDALPLEPALAFSGIADGAAFVDSVRLLGVPVVDSRDFGDHHAYGPKDMVSLGETSNARIAVTTEKDLVKVALLWPADGLPLYALRIGMTLRDEARFFAALDGIVR